MPIDILQTGPLLKACEAALLERYTVHRLWEAADKDAFHKKFKELFKRDFSIADEVDPSLVAGVLITVGDLLLDGTVANRIQQVVHESI